MRALFILLLFVVPAISGFDGGDICDAVYRIYLTGYEAAEDLTCREVYLVAYSSAHNQDLPEEIRQGLARIATIGCMTAKQGLPPVRKEVLCRKINAGGPYVNERISLRTDTGIIWSRLKGSDMCPKLPSCR